MLVRAPVLLHVVLAREGLVALRAEGVLLAGVLLGVARGVAGGGEEVGAADLIKKRTWILVLLALRLGVRCAGQMRRLRRW